MKFSFISCVSDDDDEDDDDELEENDAKKVVKSGKATNELFASQVADMILKICQHPCSIHIPWLFPPLVASNPFMHFILHHDLFVCYSYSSGGCRD